MICNVPGGVDYPRVSCLDDETWDQDNGGGVPMKYDKDFDGDYTHVPGFIKRVDETAEDRKNETNR